MVKIAVLVRYSKMTKIAARIAKEQDIDIACIKTIETVDTVNEARMAVEEGAHIIVARGYQAKLIKRYTNIPLVEIRLHAQEIGLLLKKAKVIAKKDRPRVGLIAFKNMLCDMSHMEELFGVDLFIDYLEKIEEVSEKLEEMSKNSPDLIIGGEITCQEAEKMGYPALFYESTEESISEALLAAPIQYDGQITGAILSLQRVSSTFRKDQGGQKDMFLHGFVAQTTFRHIYTENAKMKNALELAKMYALSDSPVLLYGEEGTEYYLISEAIHNNSARKSGSYISINTRGMNKEQQMEVLFGAESGETDGQARKNGAFVKADHGTVFIKGVEHLTLRVQHKICRMLLSHSISRTDASPMDNLDVRIMAFSKVNLRSLVKTGEFSEEFFYLLSGLAIDIPPLNERPEDLAYYFNKFFKENCRKYNKYFVLTKGVYDKISRLSWKGNVIQLERFCERLVLTSEKRSIDEVMVQKLYEELYPYIDESGGREKVIVYKSKEAVELGALLEKYHGNRSLVAQELGISTTTLWRRMKKYGIEAAYGK